MGDETSGEIIGITAHRELGPLRVRRLVARSLIGHLLDLKPERMLIGMAIGGDQLCARLCLALGIPFSAYVPFEGQDGVWPLPARRAYRRLLGHAYEVKVCSEGGYTPRKMHIRNGCIVRDCDRMIAIWNGSTLRSGTYGCIQETRRQHKDYLRINPLRMDDDQGLVKFKELSQGDERMSTRSHIMAAGKYKPEISDLLEYSADFYKDTLPSTTVFTTLFECVTCDQSRMLAEYCGVQVWDFNTHEIKIEFCSLPSLDELSERLECGVGETARMLRLKAAGFKFFFRPEG